MPLRITCSGFILFQTSLLSLTPHTVHSPSSSPWEQANTGQDKAQASGEDPTERAECQPRNSQEPGKQKKRDDQKNPT